MYDMEVETNQQFANVNREEYNSKYVYLKNELKQELSKKYNCCSKQTRIFPFTLFFYFMNRQTTK